MQTAAQSYFLALFTPPQAKNIQVTASYSAAGGSNVQIDGSVDMDTDFMALLGYKTLTVTGTSTTKWGSSRLRVALALDNTGSMADDGKIAALRSATKGLLTQLQNAASIDGDVYVSIIPFSRDVSVAASGNSTGTWIDWTDWAAPPANAVPSMSVGPGDNCPWSSRTNSFTCSPSPTSTATTGTVPNSGTYKGYICPSQNGSSGSYYNGCYTSTTYSSTGSSATCTGHSNCGCSGSGSSKTCKTNSGYYEHAWVTNDHSTWNGCITDRGNPISTGATGPSAGNYDQNVNAPVAGTAASYYPAEQYASCPAQYDGAQLRLDRHEQSGRPDVPQRQYQPAGRPGLGLAIADRRRAAHGAAAGCQLQVPAGLILMSDGLNTQDRWYTSQNSIDKRMYDGSNSGAGTCANIKNAGITIYTVQGEHRRRSDLDALAELRRRPRTNSAIRRSSTW